MLVIVEELWWLFDSVGDSVVPAQNLRHSQFIEALFDEYLSI